MQSLMLINARHGEERRVAIVEDGVLQELEVEYSGREQTKSNIYKGVVNRVEPSIHAVFVDFGDNRHGFLSFTEINPSLYGRDFNVQYAEGEKPTIEKNIKPGMQIMVQVVKEERESKGAYLTTYISIAGRYLVLMPGSKKGGVSRRIEDEKERAKLKEIVSFLDVPDGMGLIIRTAGMGRNRADLKRDLNNLLRVWKIIETKGKSQKAPSLIYQEGDIVIRSIRDYFSADMSEILVDNPEVFKKAKDFMKMMMPRFQGRVKLYKDNVPLFSRYNLEGQMESLFGNQVPLKSGGSLVIDPTEALVSIDVNSGRSRGEKNIEETAFRTNLEAAAEIARQLRLRDLGGLIVIDFIDMRQKGHIGQVEKALKGSLKGDKAKVDVGRISKFGLLEMSRQRIKSSIFEKTYVPCPHCGGSGTIKSVESNAVYLLRKVHEAAMEEGVEKIDLLLPSEIANDLSNRKRGELFRIEQDYSVKVEITGQPGLPVNSYNLEVLKKEKPAVASRTEPGGSQGKEGEGQGRSPKGPRAKKSGYAGARRPVKKEAGERQASSDKSETKEPAKVIEKEPGVQKGLLNRIKGAIKGS